MLATIDWSSLVTAVGGVVVDALALIAGVIATLITLTLMFRGADYVLKRVKKAVG